VHRYESRSWAIRPDDSEPRFDFSLTQLQAFSVVARQLSYVAAAEALGYSEPAVHYQVRRLEEALGSALVVRSGRGLKLTPAGTRILPHCISILAEATALRRLTVSHEELGTVSLAGGRVTAAYALPDVIAQVSRHLPSLRIELTAYDRRAVVEAVRNGDADIGLSASLDQIVDADEFELFRWRDTRYVLVSGPSVDSSTVFAVGQMNAPLTSVLSHFAAMDKELHVEFVPSADAVKSMCIAGLGYGFLRDDCVGLELRSGILQFSEDLPDPIASAIWAIVPKHRSTSEAARRFLEATRQRHSTDAPIRLQGSRAGDRWPAAGSSQEFQHAIG
jgi:DNA-binding transcriptional LysR family regulator